MNYITSSPLPDRLIWLAKMARTANIIIKHLTCNLSNKTISMLLPIISGKNITEFAEFVYTLDISNDNCLLAV